MKQIILLFIGIWPCSTIAQSKATLDLIAGIDYSYRLLDDKNTVPKFGYTFRMLNTRNTSIHAASVKYRDSIEVADIGFRGGVNINLRLGRKLFFKSGIRYISNGYKSIKVKDPGLPYDPQYKANIRFIEIPTGFRYIFYCKKISCFAECGFATTYVLNYKLKSISDVDTKSEVIRDADMLDLHFNGIISIGLQTELNDEMLLFIQPIFRYELSTLSNAPVREHLYSAGAEFGLRYYLNKK